MKIILYIGIVCAILTSCSTKKSNESGKQDTASISSQIAELENKQNSTNFNKLLNPEDSSLITHFALIKTNFGKIKIALYGMEVPKTVDNFIKLAESNFYDGLIIHRAAEDLLIQMGDPKTKEKTKKEEWGSGGRTFSGKPLIDELNQNNTSFKRGYIKGAVAMASITGQKNSATSQFFICLDKAKELAKTSTIFGRVIEGIEVVEKISKLEVEQGPFGAKDGIPKKQVIIQSIKISKNEEKK